MDTVLGIQYDGGGKRSTAVSRYVVKRLHSPLHYITSHLVVVSQTPFA